MSDRYLDFANSNTGRRLVGALGLPTPVRLERWRAGRTRPVDGALLLGGDGPLATAVSGFLNVLTSESFADQDGRFGLDRWTAEHGPKLKAVVFDASTLASTEQLTARFMDAWRRPAVVGIDDDNLTPILDAKKRRGWPRGWQREFDYVEYRGEHWDVRDVRYLFNRVFARLWADSRQSVVDYSARQGGPVYPAMAWNGQWDTLDEGRYLYLGWDSKYMLTAVQGVLEEAGWASEVFVKYSYIGDAMR